MRFQNMQMDKYEEVMLWGSRMDIGHGLEAAKENVDEIMIKPTPATRPKEARRCQHNCHEMF